MIDGIQVSFTIEEELYGLCDYTALRWYQG